MKTKDTTRLYCLLYFITLYLVYATAMIVAMENYRGRQQQDITLRVRRGGGRLARRTAGRTARRTTSNRRYLLTN